MPKVEIEFRSIISKSRYSELKKFLTKNAKDLGEDDKDVVFFIMPDKLLKVVNNASKKNAEIVFKANKIGKGSDFRETHISINQKDFVKMAEIFKNVGFTNNIMRSFQERHNYLYKGVEIALKYSEHWKYHVELEIMINSLKNKPRAEEKIKRAAEELNIRLMTDGELKKFTQKAERSINKRPGEIVSGCSIGIETFYLAQDGKVLFCPYLPVYCGDMTKEHLSQIWEQSEMLKISRNLRWNIEGKCGVCRYKMCCGGCPAYIFLTTGKLTSSDNGCWINAPVKS